MSIKELLITSFVKGIGKTSASVTVFGILGGIWYLYSSRTNFREDVKQEDIIIEETDKSDTDEVDNETVKELESIKNELEEIMDRHETNRETRNFRKIFDKI